MTQRDFEKSLRRRRYLRANGWTTVPRTSGARKFRDPRNSRFRVLVEEDVAYRLQVGRHVRALKAAGAYCSKGLWWHVNFNPVYGVPLALAAILLERWRRQMGSK